MSELEAQLPKDAIEVKQTLKDILEDEPTDGLALLILARCYLLCEESDEAKKNA